MLILSRRIGETLMIGDDITIMNERSNQVRIGVSAPGDIPVYREEIYHKIHNNEQEEKGE
ncbi:MAG TPA: carbon storage regulator CsrA [Gammaproteobacteria bacterium]|nr:carbon storage regulator CsrA [Gammaproteobacteria bacterium]